MDPRYGRPQRLASRRRHLPGAIVDTEPAVAAPDQWERDLVEILALDPPRARRGRGLRRSAGAIVAVALVLGAAVVAVERRSGPGLPPRPIAPATDPVARPTVLLPPPPGPVRSGATARPLPLPGPVDPVVAAIRSERPAAARRGPVAADGRAGLAADTDGGAREAVVPAPAPAPAPAEPVPARALAANGPDAPSAVPIATAGAPRHGDAAPPPVAATLPPAQLAAVSPRAHAAAPPPVQAGVGGRPRKRKRSAIDRKLEGIDAIRQLRRQ